MSKIKLSLLIMLFLSFVVIKSVNAENYYTRIDGG